jgi:uncharacterized protein (UPF0332 family)
MNLTPEVEAYLAKARHALEVAWKLRGGGELADAAGKAYYAFTEQGVAVISSVRNSPSVDRATSANII